MVVLWIPMVWKNSFTCLATAMWWLTVLKTRTVQKPEFQSQNLAG
jgi:hypothetical protein